jgi:predicted DNA-binding ribbon-helix-helix protein
VKKEEDVIKTTLQVPRPLWKTIKNMAFDRHVNTNDVVVEALQKAYGNEAKRT